MSVPQLLKWIGNKSKYAEQIVSYMPPNINTYIEPFLGSGAVLAELSKQNVTLVGPHYRYAIGGDALVPLIDIYNKLVEEPNSLINYYNEIIPRYNQDRENVYLEVRDRFNRTRASLDFLILTRTCYSGIIRFRKSDSYMSTPIGPHKPIDPTAFEARVRLWHELLKNVEFRNDDFKNVMDIASEGDLIYCDPPYTHSQSILYGAQSFNIEELWTEIAKAKQKGAKVILSLNGKKKSKKEDISTTIPDGLFQQYVYVDCGISMINRLQREGNIMIDENVHDLYFSHGKLSIFC